MTTLIAQIILGCSIFGILVVLFSKVPILIRLSPETESSRSNILERVNGRFKSFSFNIFLQKLLLRTKILTLKIENKISFWIDRLRQKSGGEEKGSLNGSPDSYWEELKKK